jgi:DNA ligase-1
MRYHERFKSYPLLYEAVRDNKLDIVYLDTTYSDPKHDFVPQEEAIQTIAGTVLNLLGSGDSGGSDERPKTLILLSCYSIGKEKVLWEASTRTNQLVYVNDKKLRMLECVKGHESEEVSSQIIDRCTLDPNKTCIHVIPMGMAGELWPFFRPNFLKCAKYTRELNQGYEKVVAFLPTGWAHGSKWNREHAISQKTLTDDDASGPIDVEVRLVPYSEHSAFSELVSFVQYLRPRKVVPTVFGDEADCRKIENRFRNLLDSKRAKEAFFRSMEKQPKTAKSEISLNFQATRTLDGPHEDTEVLCCSDSSDDCVEVVNVPMVVASVGSEEYGESVATLVAMGFSSREARSVLALCNGDLRHAVDRLLNASSSVPMGRALPPTLEGAGSMPSAPRVTTSTSWHTDKKRKTPPSAAKDVTITSFFAKKKST